MKTLLKKIATLTTTLLVIMTLGSGYIFTIAQAQEKVNATNTDELFRPFKYTSGNSTTPQATTTTNADGSKISIVQNIANRTQGNWQDILANIIKFILSITGALALITFSYAGIMMVTARGAEEQIKKGKDMIFLSILALAIIATSYAIVLGVSNLKF